MLPFSLHKLKHREVKLQVLHRAWIDKISGVLEFGFYPASFLLSTDICSASYYEE